MLEYDWFVLARAFHYGYGDVMAMPSSRRHKLVKWHESPVNSGRSRQFDPTEMRGDRLPTSWFESQNPGE